MIPEFGQIALARVVLGARASDVAATRRSAWPRRLDGVGSACGGRAVRLRGRRVRRPGVRAARRTTSASSSSPSTRTRPCPMFYKATAAWGGHEGSMLLRIAVLAVWTMAVAAGSRSQPQEFSSRVLGVLGIVSAGMIAFAFITSNPFTRLIPAAPDGNDLNPLLQDPGMIFHPPTLYFGYVGVAVPFGFAVAALLTGRLDKDWARWTRPWTVVAWMFLTAGITLGSWWAYYELGWGGWWFWDPVENSSFMPWLMTTALLHSLAVTERRGIFKSWTVSARDRGVLAELARHVPDALARHGLGARVRRGSDARSVHSRAARRCSRAARCCSTRCVRATWKRRAASSWCRARRSCSATTSCWSSRRARAVRHDVPAVHRRARARQDLRRPAVLQSDVPAADAAVGRAARYRHAYGLAHDARRRADAPSALAGGGAVALGHRGAVRDLRHGVGVDAALGVAGSLGVPELAAGAQCGAWCFARARR